MRKRKQRRNSSQLSVLQYNSHTWPFNSTVYFPSIFFFLSAIYYQNAVQTQGKDIGLNTDSVVLSWVSHMNIWSLSFPIGKKVEGIIPTHPPYRMLWLLNNIMDIMYLIYRESQQRQPLPLLLPPHYIFLIEAQGGRKKGDSHPLFTGEKFEMQQVCEVTVITLLV